MTGAPRKLWGGRFTGAVDPEIHGFSASLPFDRRLVRHDLIGSLAHARMLRDTGVLPASDADAILSGLSALLADVEAGRLAVGGEDEDVHSWIERVLFERIGGPAGRLPTARSRNDQTAVALRLFVREAIEDSVEAIVTLQDEWLIQARAHGETWMPGYTHLQRGQPVSLGHHLLAHFWFLAADRERFERAHRTAGVSPLGAGALAGTPHAIDPRGSARLLGFEDVFANSVHAVSDRDYAVEAVFAAALTAVHLSRWAEEVVLWTSSEFGFATLSDSIAKGSSLMPQKKNPEPAELVRGKAGRVIGDLTTLLVVLKVSRSRTGATSRKTRKPSSTPSTRPAAPCGRPGSSRADSRSIPRASPRRFGKGTRPRRISRTTWSGRAFPFRTAHEQAGRAVVRPRNGTLLWQTCRSTCCEASVRWRATTWPLS